MKQKLISESVNNYHLDAERLSKLNKHNTLKLELLASNEDRTSRINRLMDLDRQLQTSKAYHNASPSNHSPQLSSKHYLDQLKQLQIKTKQLSIEKFDVFPTPKPVILNEETLKKFNAPKAPIKMQVLMPRSEVMKAKKIQPAMVQRTLKNGEVCNVYILSDSNPSFDPLEKVEVLIDRNEVKRQEIRLEKLGQRGKSMSPEEKQISSALVEPEFVKLRQMTPQMKVDSYSYRDYKLNESMEKPTRNWVGKRMKVYAEAVKSSFKPRVSERKQLELMLINEKLRKSKNFSPNKLKMFY